MCKLVVLSLVLICAGITSSTASATHSSGEGPRRDLVAGSGSFDVSIPSVTIALKAQVNASSGPSGEDPRGHFSVKGQVFSDVSDYDVQVDCVRVTGNTAQVSGRVSRSRTPFPPVGQTAQLFVEDNGEPGSPGDTFGWGFNIPCTGGFSGGTPVNHGNFIVHDASP